jgi:hypothetical protein
MSIAAHEHFRKEHIEAHAFDAPFSLAEQAVHCLELVAQLVQSGLSFQFKGGNSLLLILPTPQRFSIDVDIATDESRERIEECLDMCIQRFEVFTRWTKRQHKTKPWLPIASYQLYYHSHFTDPENAFIMLDVQLRRSPYKTGMKPVVCGELYVSNILVELPLPAGIIGDKLLTIGPKTLGIPLGKGKEAQRLKHVYDVSTLCGTNPSLSDIRDSFHACLGHENELQEKTISVQEIMADTLAFCAWPARFALSPAITANMDGALKEIVVGLAPFAGHLFARAYTWNQLQSDAARTALCITAACCPGVSNDTFHATLQAIEATKIPSVSKLPCDDAVRAMWGAIVAWSGLDILKV